MNLNLSLPWAGRRALFRSSHLRFAGAIVFLCVWELAYRLEIVPERYFTGPVGVLQAFGALLFDATFWSNQLATMLRSIAGLAYGTVLGLAMALAGACAPVIGRALSPVVELMRSLPPAALVPLAIFSLGLGPSMFAFIVGFAVVWAVYLSAANALASTDKVLVAVGRSLGLSPIALLWRIRVPGALPETMTGVRIAAAQALMATVAAEMLAGQNGLGFMLMDSAFTLQTDITFALLLISGANGALLSRAVVVVSSWSCRWHRKLSAHSGEV